VLTFCYLNTHADDLDESAAEVIVDILKSTELFSTSNAPLVRAVLANAFVLSKPFARKPIGVFRVSRIREGVSSTLRRRLHIRNALVDGSYRRYSCANSDHACGDDAGKRRPDWPTGMIL
jgi:hypothetical protein